MHPKRVAVIVVHGVADQKPGDTATAVIELLVASAPSRTAYTALSSEDLTLAVAPLAPRNARPERDDATPRGEDRPLPKSFAQSVCSDFHRDERKTSDAVTPAASAASTDAASTDANDKTDHGIDASNYLLTKHRDNGAHPEAYATRRIDVERTEVPWSPTAIAVYEMYWADLSRLSGAIPRIITEMFTMIFRLSKLGRGTVDAACDWRLPTHTPGLRARIAKLAWPATAWLQRALDWLFVNLLALLFAQLLLLAIVLVVLGFASTVESKYLHRAIAGAIAGISVLLWAYRFSERKISLGLLAFTLGIIVVIVALVPGELLQWGTVLLLFVVITLVYEAALRVADDRFPLVHFIGRLLWVCVLAVLLLDSVHNFALEGVQVSMHATFFAVEIVLQAVKVAWICVGVLLFLWFVAGCAASLEPEYESKASVATGRLGLCVSIGSFLMMTMAIWALLSSLLDISAEGTAYTPCLFTHYAPTDKESEEDGKAAKRKACLETYKCAEPPHPAEMSIVHRCWDAPASTGPAPRARAQYSAPSSAQTFLKERFRASTEAFSFIATFLLGLVVYIAIVFIPSVLAELKLLVNRTREAFEKNVRRVQAESSSASALRADALRDAEMRNTKTRRLGRWLTTGFENLDGVVLIVVAVGLLLAIIVVFFFAFSGLAESLQDYRESAIDLSRSLLKPFVLGAATFATAFSLLGGVLSKYLPALRAPLDIALDVDNHFREFPRTAIPRARIFSRYTALLAHVAAEGYDRVVIVSHSQGTVISAELLRFLSSDGKHAPLPGAQPCIGGEALPPISILTLGCPLRQLYAARFPTLYRWVIGRQKAEAGFAAVDGPRAGDIGVERWFNAYCSGDYVGRWLWSIASTDDPIGHPMIDTADVKLFGRADAYSAFDPMPPLSLPFADQRQAETCLGLGAHTHYFEREQKDVAWLIDYLVAR